MNDSNIIDVNEAEFNEKIIEASDNKLIIVDFWAPWCGPCKQLTPLLEKVAKKNIEKVTLAKINIDENQQIAAQLRIQSIPTVFAFKNKKIANAFQGVISEKDIVEFIEKALGEKLEEDFSEFYESVEKLIEEKNFDNAKDALLEFISNNSKNIKAFSLYLECLLETADQNEIDEFIDSLDDEIKNDVEIKKIIKRLAIIKNNSTGPSLENLLEKFNKKPNDINLVLEIADNYFSNKKYEEAFNLLIEKYPKNKEKVKQKMLDFFEALGDSHESTIIYRKKLSSIMFS